MVIKILFIHSSRNSSVEYSVHFKLTKYADSSNIKAQFIWQDSSGAESLLKEFEYYSNLDVIFDDFGRDMTLQINRWNRALSMGINLGNGINTIRKSINQFRPDIIYTSQAGYDLLWGNTFSKIYNIPHIIHLHYTVGPWLGASALRIIKNSNRIIACSEFIKQNAMLAGVNSRSIRVVPNPLELNKFVATQGNSSVREEFNILSDTPMVLAVGRLDPSKGFPLLLNSFSKVLQDCPETKLIICGESTTRGNYKKDLIQLVAQLGIGDNVIFAGHRFDIQNFFREADIFVLATELEPFGLVFLEAMAMELPIVAIYSGAVPEIVVNNRTGLISSSDNVDELSSNLSKLGSVDISA